jgi:hypothetical protein
MTDQAPNKEQLKKTLESAKAELDKAVKRIDKASPEQLHEISGLAHVAAAFVDFNKGCG